MRKFYFPRFPLLAFLLVFFNTNTAFAQCTPCGAVTTINVNLSANPDTVWSTSSTRSGLCCGASGTNCIRFNVTVHPQATQVGFNVANPSPPGGAFYQLNCGPQTSLGTPLCVVGMTNFCIVFCKSGGDSPTYTISSSRTFQASPDITINSNCTGQISVGGLNESSISWNSIFPGSFGQYNSYLSCTSQCDTTFVNAQPGFPPFVDYIACGTTTGCASGTSCDTVRVNFVPGLVVNTSPLNPVICSGNPITLTTNVSGGSPPYSYSWNTGATTSSINVNTPGTYIVSVTDGTTNCPPRRDTIIVGSAPLPSPPSLISNSPVCVGSTINLFANTISGAIYNWTGPNSFTSTNQNPTIPNAASANAGTYSATVTVAGCTSAAASTSVSVNPIPAAPTANGLTICSGNTATLTATAPGGTYEWYNAPSGGTLLFTGASYTTPTLSSTTTYYVQTTVGGCTGPRTAVTVTVNPTPAAPTALGTTICSGSTAALTATAPGGTYEWYNAASGGTLLHTGASYTTPTLTSTTTYYVQTTVGGCTSARTAVTVIVNPIPAAPTASGTTICSGNTATLTATAPGGTYEWYNAASGGTLLFTGASYTTPTLSSTTTYYVQTTVGGCTSPRTAVTVTVNPIPAAPTALGTTICSGSTATLTATAPGGTYEWYNAPSGGTLLFTGASYTTPTLSTTTTYYVQTTVGGCTGPRTAVTVTVNPTPAAPTASGTTICSGSTATITATAPGGTYEWYNLASGGTLLHIGASYTTPTLSVTTTYYVQTTVGGCTSPRTAVTVIVNPIPAAPTASGTTICSGNTATLTATAPGGTYEWYNLASGGTLLHTGASYITPALSSTTTYYVQTTVGGCTSPRTAVTVTVNPIPAAPTASGTTICSGNTATLTATAPGGTYQWYNAPSGGTLLFTGANYTTPVLSSTTTYYVQTTVGGCVSPRTAVTVTVNPTPAAPTANGVTICEGNTATLNATAPGGTYEWYDASAGGSLLTTGASYTTPVLTVNDTFYVQTTISGCTSARTAVIVTVTPTDDPSFNYSSGTYCVTGTNPTPTITGGFGGTFSSSPSGLSINASAGTINLASSSLGTYTVTFTTNGPCPASSSVTITITNAPDATFSYTTPLCQSGANILPSFSIGASGGVFSSTPSGLVFVNTSTGEINTSASAPGSYTITNFIAAAGGCASASSTFSITIDQAATVNAGSYADICAGASLTLNGVIGGSASSATWSGGGGTYTPNATTLNASYTPSASEQTVGSFTLILTTNDPAGACSAVSDTVTANIIPLPAAPTANGVTICEGTSTTLTATAPGGTYQWYNAPSGGTLLTTGAIYTTPVLTTTTTYYVQTTVNSCAGPRTQVTVTVTPLPAAPTASGVTICSGNTASLTATAPGGTYEWFNDSIGGSSIGTGANFTTPVLTITDTFYVQTIISGCPGPRTAVIVTVNPIPAAPTVANPTICSGSGAILTATAPGGTYEWYDAASGGNLLQTGATYSTGPLTSTTTYFVQTTVGGCTSPRTAVTVTVNPIPVAPTANGVTICEGNTATLTATAPGGTYRWYNLPTGGTLLFTGANFTTPVLFATKTYYVQTTVGGCTSPRTPVTVTVIPNDDPAFAYSSGTYCITGTDPSPTISGTTGGTFSASPSGLSINPSTGTINLASSSLGAYTITYTTNGACPMSSSVTVTITTSPDATFSYSGPYCQFTSNPLPTFPSGASAGVFSATPSGLNFVNTGTGGIDLSATAAGTYTITNFIAAAGGCASATHTSTVVIEEAATANAGVNQTICVGATVSLNGSFGGSATSATWSGGAGTYSPSNTSMNAIYTPTAAEYTAGSVTLILTTNAPGGICAAGTDTVVITFNEDDPSFTYSSGTYCATGTNPVAIITGGSSGTFTVSPSGLVFVNTSTGEINLSASALGSYTVTFTTNGTCPASSSMSITITNGFDATHSYTSPVCQNSANQLPVFIPGASAGIFSAAPSGLVFVSTSTGEIDVVTSAPGTYLITNFIAASGGCASATHTSSFTIDVPATANAGSDINICVGQNATLSGTIGGAATSATWSGGLGTFTPSSSALNATYTPDPSETSVTLILTTNDPSGPCTAVSDTVVITINPIPASPTASGDTICEGTSTTLIATAPGGSYQWFSNPTGGSSLFNGAAFNTPVLTATTTYYVQTTLSGCPSAVRTPVTVVVVPTDDPSFTYASSTYCVSGGNASPTITGTPNGTFTATPSGLVFANTSTGEIDVATSTLGTYTITYTTNGQCPDSATFTVTITNAPDATFSYNGPYCTSGSNPLPTFPSGASAGVFTSTPSGLVFVNPNTGQINLSASAPGLYTVTNDILAAGGCAAATFTNTVEILPAPLANAGTDTTLCANNVSVLLNGSVTNAGGMVWSTAGDGTFAPDTVSASVTYIAGSNDILNTSVVIYLTTTQNGVCNAHTDSITITINPAPVVNAGADILICDGTYTATLNGSVTGVTTSGLWTSLGTGTFAPDNISLNASYTFSPQDTVNGSVLLVLESTNNGGCIAVYDTVEVILSSPASVFAGNDTLVCASSTQVQLGGIVVGGTGNGIWTSSGNGVFIPSANDLNAVYEPDSADINNGFVTLVLEAVNSCVPAFDTIVISFDPAPIVNVGNNVTICEGDNAALNATLTNASSGTWTSTGTGTFTPDAQTLNAVYTPSSDDVNNGSVMLIFTTSGSAICDDASDTLILTIEKSPQAGFIFANACQGAVVQFTDASTSTQGNIATWSWNFGNGDTSTVQNPGNSFAAGTYTVTLVVATSAGCADSIQQTVEIFPAPNADFTAIAGCDNAPVRFTDVSTVSSGTITTWAWNFGDSNQSSQQNPTHTYNGAGTYTVTLTVTTVNGCSSSDTMNVTVVASPIAEYTPTGGTYNIGESILVTDQSQNASTWSWNFGDNSGTSTEQNPAYSFNNSGTFEVVLTVTNGQCSDTVKYDFIINPATGETPIGLPTAFTPNGDGNNDVLYVRGGPFTELEHRIYNEWGNMIFISQSQAEGWDGTYKGAEQPAGKYIWIIKGITIGGETINVQQEVTIIR